LPRISLIEDLTTGPIPAGSNLLVEYDPASQWYNASLTIAAAWLKDGGTLSYRVAVQPPDNIRLQLNKLGLNAEELEGNSRLVLWDWYMATLGRKSKEKFVVESLKAADLSIWYSKYLLAETGPAAVGWRLGPDVLRIADDTSCLARFNDEKSWVELVVARASPSASLMKSTRIAGVMSGSHSEWAYKQLEAAADGIIDFKLEEADGEARNYMRLRTMRNVPSDSKWHLLKLSDNLEVTIEK
jgi:KaiC/GvpD/RAD55 family RecA-like ATPase